MIDSKLFRHLINFGFVRALCHNLQDFRLYKDLPIQGSYDPHFQEQNTQFKPFPRSSPLKFSLKSTTTQSNFRVFSFGSLFKTVYLLDIFLCFLNNKRQQILLSFTVECLEKFKPLVDTFYQTLSTLVTVDQIKVKVIFVPYNNVFDDRQLSRHLSF